MLRCWSCSQPFMEKLVERDGLIKGREKEQGGPYRLYSCPSCHKPSIVETTPAGRLFASPYKDISLMDFLFGWIQPLSPTDYLRILDWQRNFGARRRHFFERDGDKRYSSGTLMGWLEKLIPGNEEAETSVTSRTRSAPANSRSKRVKDNTDQEESPLARRRIPHPYRILEIPQRRL